MYFVLTDDLYRQPYRIFRCAVPLLHECIQFGFVTHSRMRSRSWLSIHFSLVRLVTYTQLRTQLTLWSLQFRYSLNSISNNHLTPPMLMLISFYQRHQPVGLQAWPWIVLLSCQSPTDHDGLFTVLPADNSTMIELPNKHAPRSLSLRLTQGNSWFSSFLQALKSSRRRIERAYRLSGDLSLCIYIFSRDQGIF